MTTSTSLEVLGLLAVLSTAAYFPALKAFPVLASPYVKANLTKRLVAAALDGSLVVACWLAFENTGSIAFPAAAIVYALARDAVRGQSLGKFIVGQIVIDVETGRRCTLAGSIKRNALFVLPGANIIAIFLETHTMVRDQQGQRLGDRVGRTQVVEGLGVTDVVSEIQKWWTSFIARGAKVSQKVRSPVG